MKRYTREQLRDNSASVSIESVSQDASLIKIVVKVVNKTGHKFPSGVPARRTWIHLMVTDANGDLVFESGRPNRDGSIVGNDADTDPSAFEPHYDIIDSPDKVQIYEGIAFDSEKEVTYAFLKSVEHIKENKLLPAGFNKTAVPDDITPHGEALDDPNFVGGSDLVTYLVRIQSPETFTIKAKLLYQSLSFAFVKDLLSLQDQSDQVSRFGRYYENADRTPFTVSFSEIKSGP